MKLLYLAALAALAVSAASCGAKTGLIVPDVAVPPDARDAAVPPDALDADVPIDAFRAPTCMPGTFTLIQRKGDAILVVDRSGSMSESLTGGRGGAGTSKWSLLQNALATTLPTFQDQIDFGALFFPEQGAPNDTSCDFVNVPDVDIDPAPGNAAPIVGVFSATSPAGATPTAAALLRAYTWFVRHPDPARARYLVLATDGGPNCNAALDPATCVCAGMGGRGGFCGRGTDGSQCLDATRTVQLITQLASNPVQIVPTYVIGLAADSDPVFVSTLTAMAVAGGRPNLPPGGAPTFYNVEASGDLVTAFSAIQGAIARCTFLTPSRPDNPDAITLTLDGASIMRDTTHMDGWDWTDTAFGEITLFGPACAQASAHAVSVVATVQCESDGG